MTKGIGRWIYCKYCYKNVYPKLGNVNQILCPECGSGLTPDFFTYNALLMWLNEKEEEAQKYDRESEEGKEAMEAWFAINNPNHNKPHIMLKPREGELKND